VPCCAGRDSAPGGWGLSAPAPAGGAGGGGPSEGVQAVPGRGAMAAGGVPAWVEERLQAAPAAHARGHVGAADSHHEKIRREGDVRSTAVLWVMGVHEDGYREHLRVWLGSTESQSTWGRGLQELLGRGHRGVRYIVSDEQAGLRDTHPRLPRGRPAALPGALPAQTARAVHVGRTSSRSSSASRTSRMMRVWSPWPAPWPSSEMGSGRSDATS
jgi:hypothetical protein